MSSNRNLSVFVVGVCLFVPMGMYVDSELKNRELIEELFLNQNGANAISAEYLSNGYLSEGGQGGPVVGIDAIVDSAPSGGIFNASGGAVEVVRVDLEDESSFNTTANTRKVIHVKIAETVWPVEQVAISSDFGWRNAPCEGCSSDHQGVDFVPGAGTKVFSVYQGIVTSAGWDGGYGNRVEVTHYVTDEDGVTREWKTLYAHMQSDSIPDDIYVGAVVQTGQVIGLVGSTGLSTGAHLHFELLIEGEYVDPMPILGHYELVEMSEEELREYAFTNGIPELTFQID